MMSKNRPKPIGQPNSPAASVSIESKSFSGTLPPPQILALDNANVSALQVDHILADHGKRDIMHAVATGGREETTR
jgi:hypothetical protein